MDVTWHIETADFGTLEASGVLANSLPSITVGEELTLNFYFGQEKPNHVDDYKRLKEFGRRTNDGTIDTGLDIRGKPWYRERLHPEVTWTTGVVKLVPGSDVGALDSYWAIITGTEDATYFVGTGERIAVDVFILAKASTYNQLADVESDMKAEL